MAKTPKVHVSIRTCLGYNENDTDAAVMRDWKQRQSRVCKPCWELKYCPYGPLVEQAPLLPTTRAEALKHIEGITEMVRTNTLGGVWPLSEEDVKERKRWLRSEKIVFSQALFKLHQEERTRQAATSDDPAAALLGGPLPPMQEYRVPYGNLETPEPKLEDFPPEVQRRLVELIDQTKLELAEAIRTKTTDSRKPMDEPRRLMFQQWIDNFDEEDHPPEIPMQFQEGSCTIFGHICPVFFCAEAMTETSEDRRRGRYIPFKTKVRVVRRDNYTCQKCSKHLQDNEVEFDHRIPHSKGGSAEESNIFLTCFDCNRSKSDTVEI